MPLGECSDAAYQAKCRQLKTLREHWRAKYSSMGCTPTEVERIIAKRLRRWRP